MVDLATLESLVSGPGEPQETGPVDPRLADLVTFSPGEQVSGTRGPGGELGRGLGAGINETQAGLYGFAQMLGQMTGSETIKAYGRAGALENLEQAALHGPETNSLAEIDGVRDFFNYAAGGLGKSLPSIAMAMTGGGISAAAARKVFMNRLKAAVIADARAALGANAALEPAMISQGIRDALRNPSVHRMLANVTNVSAGLGAGLSEVPVESGGIVTDLDQRGLEAPYTALLGGVAVSALDALPATRLIGKMFPGVPPAMARGFIEDLALTTGSQALLEGSTEGAQEVISMAALAFHDPDFEMFDGQGIMRVLDSAAIGALVGAVSGGAGAAAGQVTNRAADTTNRVRAGGARLQTFIQSQVTRDVRSDPADVEAESLIPGWTEIRDKVSSGLSKAYESAVSGLRTRAADGVDAAIKDGNGGPNASLAGWIDRAEDQVRERIAPEMARLNTRVRDVLTKVREKAKTLAADQRVAYVRAELEKLSGQVTSYVTERFGRIVGTVEQETTEKINTENLPDEDDFGFEDDPTDPEDANVDETTDKFQAVTVEPKRVFGDKVKRVFSAGKGETTAPVSVRTRGEEAIPFKTHAEAVAAYQEIREKFLGLSDDAIQIIEKDKGYLVAIYDEGAGEEIFQQERTNDTLTKAFALARKKDRRTNPRVAALRRPGAVKPTHFDLPTLAFGGKDVAQRGGIAPSENDLVDALRGLDTILARMITQGYGIDVEALNDRELFPGMTVGEARAKTGRNWTSKSPAQTRASRTMELLRGTLRELGDRGPQGTRVVNITLDGKPAKEVKEGKEQPSFEVQTVEERTRPSEEEQAAASGRDTYTPSTMKGAGVTTSPSNKNVRVGLLGQPQRLRDRVTQLVSDMAKLTGLQGKEFIIVDTKGAAALLNSKDFPSEWKAMVLKAIADIENGKTLGSVLHGDGKRKVIFLSDKNFERESILIRTLLHEMGHVIQRSHYDKLPDARWRQNKDGEVIGPSNLKAHMEQDHEDSKSPLEFNEWMADQFLAWAVRDRKPKTLIGKFFARVAEALSQFFNVFQQKFPLSTTYEQFIQGVVGVSSADANINEWGRELLATRFTDQGIASKPGKLILDVNESVKLLNAPPPGFGHLAPEIENLPSDNVVNAADRFRPKDKANRERESRRDTLRGEQRALYEQMDGLMMDERYASEFNETIIRENEIDKRRDAKRLDDIVVKQKALIAKINAIEDELRELDAPVLENLNIAQARQQARAQWATIRQRLNVKYPAMMKHAEAMFRAAQRINDQWFSSLNGAIRRMNIEAFDQVANMFNKTPGTNLNSPLYFDQIQKRRGEFSTRLNLALAGASVQDIAAAQVELTALNGRAGQHQNPVAQAVRAVLDEFHTYMVESGLLMEHVENYFPKIWDHEAVAAGEQEIRALLAANGVQPTEIDLVFEHMLEHDGAEATFQRNVHPRAHIAGEPSNNFIKARGRVLTDAAFDKFLSTDTRRTVERYMNAAVKRAEFNRLLGSDARKTGAKHWDPRGKWLAILRRGQAQGATQEQLTFMNDAVEAMLGRYGRNTPDRVRRMMAWIATYENVRILGFSQLSSLPDLVGPAMRTGEYQRAFQVLREQMKNITDKQSDLAEAARVWGIISDSLNQHVLTEHYDTHWFPERARRINDAFFRGIGMERLNNFVRSYSLAVGMDFLERRGVAAFSNKDPNAIRDLAELGLTGEDVIDWIAGGRKIHGSAKTTLSTTKAYDERVSHALIRFVNEANMRPNPSSRPLRASHPALMLVWHLKSFMFSFYDVFIRQIMLNAQRAGTPWQKAYVVAVPALMMMAMTAAGLELRELIQYKIWGAEGRTDRMDAGTYMWEMIQRSGLLGPSQLAADWETANDRGTAGIIAIGGPTLGQLADAISQKPSTTIAKAIPGVNQIPALRQGLADALASE